MYNQSSPDGRGGKQSGTVPMAAATAEDRVSPGETSQLCVGDWKTRQRLRIQLLFLALTALTRIAASDLFTRYFET